MKLQRTVLKRIHSINALISKLKFYPSFSFVWCGSFPLPFPFFLVMPLKYFSLKELWPWYGLKRGSANCASISAFCKKTQVYVNMTAYFFFIIWYFILLLGHDVFGIMFDWLSKQQYLLNTFGECSKMFHIQDLFLFCRNPITGQTLLKNEHIFCSLECPYHILFFCCNYSAKRGL